MELYLCHGLKCSLYCVTYGRRDSFIGTRIKRVRRCKSAVIMVGSGGTDSEARRRPVCWYAEHVRSVNRRHYEFPPVPLSTALLLSRWSISQWGDTERELSHTHTHTYAFSALASDCLLQGSACWRSSVMSLAEQAAQTPLPALIPARVSMMCVCGGCFTGLYPYFWMNGSFHIMS